MDSPGFIRSLWPLLGPYPVHFVVAELPHVGFCVTVRLHGYDSVDAVTKVSTRGASNLFKVLLSNCVQNPKSELVPYTNMTAAVDVVKLMTGDRLINNIHEHGTPCKKKGRHMSEPHMFDARW